MVFVAPLEELGLAFASFFRVIWEWKAEAGVTGGEFGPDRDGEVGIDFVGGDLSVVVGVEVEHGIPERFRVERGVIAAALAGGGEEEEVGIGDGDGDGFTGEAVEVPFFLSGIGVVAVGAAVAEGDEVLSVGMVPDHGGGPGASVVGAWGFPGDGAVVEVEGDYSGAADLAVGEVGIVIEQEYDLIVMDDGGGGVPVHVFGCGEWVGPEEFTLVVEAEEAIGGEVGADELIVSYGGGCCGGGGFVDGFEWGVGCGVFPEGCAVGGF